MNVERRRVASGRRSWCSLGAGGVELLPASELLKFGGNSQDVKEMEQRKDEGGTFQFEKGHKVLCYHDNLLYEALVRWLLATPSDPYHSALL
jgi:hypothetical protein